MHAQLKNPKSSELKKKVDSKDSNCRDRYRLNSIKYVYLSQDY